MTQLTQSINGYFGIECIRSKDRISQRIQQQKWKILMQGSLRTLESKS